MSAQSDFVARCVTARRRQGMSQGVVAEQWGKHFSAVSKVEVGQQVLTFDDAVAWSDILGVSLVASSGDADAFEAGRLYERQRMLQLLQEPQ